MDPESTIVKIGTKKYSNPLRSRSTIIALAAIGSFLIFSYMVVIAGYFDAGFGAAGLMFLTGVVKYAFDHQALGNDSKPENK